MAKKTYTKLFRQQFVDSWFSIRDEVTFGEHCARFGVSRQAAYEWLRKFTEGGVEALETQSSAPHECPHATDDETVEIVIAARQRHPTWGPRKLKAWLAEQQPWEIELPALSTMGSILKRAGLVPTRKRRRRVVRQTMPFREVEAPNDVWTTDFKGHFKTRDGHRCYPLTLVDCFSRYVLRCDAHTSPNARVRKSFESAFIEYGLPLAIRSDNGTPFVASRCPAGLSTLSVWWVRLGILPQRIAPASPWENGRHERMHRTLKQEATQPAQANRRQQQRAFDDFRHEFNNERPHEALGLKPPSSLYNPSRRPYPRRLAELEYPSDYQLRRVNEDGAFSWEGRRLFLSTVLRGQVVALKRVADTTWELYFGPLLLGLLDNTTRALQPLPSTRS